MLRRRCVQRGETEASEEFFFYGKIAKDLQVFELQ